MVRSLSLSDARTGRISVKCEGRVLLLREVQKILDAEVLVGEDKLDMEVKTAFGADLMSDVLAYAVSGCLLLTGLTNHQVIRTADVLDIAAIIIVRGKKPSPETLKAAAEKKIPVLSTKYILFESAGRLYKNGIVGCVEKVDEPRVRL
jgi:predicted transcriptional regulator